MKVIPKWSIAVLAVYILGLYWAPTDGAMGESYRLIYLHVPFAWNALLGTFLAAGAAGIYLWKREEEWDRTAQGLVEASAFLAAMALATGSLWGRYTWGVWWTWDARLTTFLILFLLLAGTIVVRDMLGTTPRARRAASIVAIVAALDVPIVHLSVRLWRTLHQDASVLKPDRPSMDAEMLWVLLGGAVAVGWWLFATAGARMKALEKVTKTDGYIAEGSS
ncbi:cytochrome c biogenesis protein CcsA [bacterium]|nr:cytochrome c biogenesis protein CcsA [bacterium]